MPIETGSWYTEYRNEPSRSDLAASSEMQMQCFFLRLICAMIFKC